MSNVVLLYTATVAEEVHLVYLLLVLHLQLLLLGYKLGPKFLHLLLQSSILPFSLLTLGLRGLTLPPQPLSLSLGCFLLPLRRL